VDKRAVILAFALIMTVFGGGYLYAQEDGDIDDSSQEEAGVSFIPDDSELSSLLTAQPNPHAVVKPLIQSKWHQGFPFNSKYAVIDGKRNIAGCGPVAVAQLLNYHKHPVRGSGVKTGSVRASRIGNITSLDFDVTFDWANMLNTYRSDGKNSNEQQQSAVGTLFYYVAGSYPYSQELVNHFGYDKSIQRPQRVFYTDAEWQAMIRKQLDLGLPVYYWGNHPGSDHAFIVDGYDSIGRFHINWGWGGKHNGWYSLDNLNPGGGEKKWYNNQRIVINLKPDAGGTPQGYEIALTAFAASKTSVTQNELFTVTPKIRNVSVLGIFPGGQLGAALVDGNGKIVEVIGLRSRAALKPLVTTGNLAINCFVPETVRPGQYRLMTVIRPSGGDWKIVTKAAVRDGVSNAINFTVTAESGAPGGGYGLELTVFTVDKTTVSQKEPFTVTARTRNRGAEKWPGGQTGAALVDNSGNIAAVAGSRNTGGLGIGYSNNNPFEIKCSVPDTLRDGQYRLRIVVRPAGGEWRIATLSTPDIPNSIGFWVGEPDAHIPLPSAVPVNSPSAAPSTPTVDGTGNLTVIPSPVIRTSSRTATFYWHGKRVSATALPVYDSSDKLVSGVEINDGATSGAEGVKRRVGVWHLKDLDGRPVPAGRYTVRGVLKTPDGEPVRVGLVVDVR